MCLFISSIQIHKQHYDTTKWFLPYYYYNILPFDETTVPGWYFEFFLQMYGGYAYVFIMAATCTFFGSCSYYIQACHSQIRYMFKLLDKMAQNRVNLQSLELGLNEIILFHNRIIRWVY